MRLAGRIGAALIGASLLATMASPRAQGAKDTELLFGGFGGTLQRAMQTYVIRAFEKQTGIHVVYVTGTSTQMLAKVRAQGPHPQLDVIWTTETTHDQGRALGVYEKLDPKIVTNLADLTPSARMADDVGVGMGMQALALEYDTKVFKQKGWAPPTSWSDLWDPRFKGHVVSYNVPIGYANGFLALTSVLNGGSTADLAPAWPRIKALVPNVLAFVNPPAQMDALFATGGAWIAYNGSGRIGDLAATGVPVAMAIPKEGALANPDFFDVVHNAPHPHAAQEFVNFALGAEMQAQIAEHMELAPVNTKTKLPPEIAARFRFGPKGVESLRHVDMATLNAKLDQVTQHWDELVAHK